MKRQWVDCTWPDINPCPIRLCRSDRRDHGVTLLYHMFFLMLLLHLKKYNNLWDKLCIQKKKNKKGFYNKVALFLLQLTEVLSSASKMPVRIDLLTKPKTSFRNFLNKNLNFLIEKIVSTSVSFTIYSWLIFVFYVKL